jgi:hypothetical protein
MNYIFFIFFYSMKIGSTRFAGAASPHARSASNNGSNNNKKKIKIKNKIKFQISRVTAKPHARKRSN